MSYHKPPDLLWVPAGLSQILCSMDLSATVVDEQVNITATVTDAMLWDAPKPNDPDRIERIELQRRIREITSARTGDFEITIRYEPNKFIRNVLLTRDREMPWKPWKVFEKTIQQAMTEYGLVEVTRQFEQSIARRHCNNLSAIESLEEQIELQRKRKEKFVYDRDFVSAAQARDTEYDARDRLDALVKKAAMGT